MEQDTRILFLPGNPNLKLNQTTDIDFFLTDEERKKFSNVEDFVQLDITQNVSGSRDCYLVTLGLSCVVDLIDDHDNDRIDEVEIQDEVQITILPGDDENSDILPDKDGSYDLRGSILALLFSAIPENYSEVDLKNGSDEFRVYSDEEYQEEKKKKNSPFASLDDSLL